MRFYCLDKLINLQLGYRRVFKIDQLDLMLIEIDGDYHLLESQCPHRAHPLSESDLYRDERGVSLRCPLHGYRFALPGGEPVLITEEPCRGLKTFTLAYREKDVGIWLD